MTKTHNKQLAEIAVDALEKGVSVRTVADQIAATLIVERRSRDVAGVVRAIEKELARRGAVQVTVTSVHKVESAVKEQLARALGVNKPYFSEVIDSSVIGGVKATVLDQELDLTVKGKLMSFKKALNSSK